MKQGKKYISPGAWFSMVYPADWNEFEIVTIRGLGYRGELNE